MAVGERIYRFGEFQLDSEARLLLRGEERVGVEARVLDLLLYLVSQRGRTVSRLELTRALWGDHPVSDGSLRRTVSLLRKALDARGPSGTAVETVHGRGYRFAACVETVDDVHAERDDAEREPSERRPSHASAGSFEGAASMAAI